MLGPLAVAPRRLGMRRWRSLVRWFTWGLRLGCTELLVLACPSVAVMAGTNAQLTAAADAYARGDMDEAIRLDTALLDAGTASVDDRAEAHAGRGASYARIQRYDLAISDFTAAIQLKPSDPNGYFARGLIYRQNGDDELAIADYNSTIRLAPYHAGAYNNRGFIYATEGRLDLAFGDFGRA